MAAGPVPTITSPPPAPDIQAQQAGPLSQYLSGPGAMPQLNPLMLAEQKLNEVAMGLKDVARILVMSKPALMPVLQKMVEAGSMLMAEVQKDNPANQAQAGMGAPGPEAGPAPPEGAPPGM